MFYEGGGSIDGVKGYLLSVFAAAIICAIATRLMGDKGTHAVMTKLITGLALTFTVISPLAQVRLDRIPDWSSNYAEAGSKASEEGQRITREALSAGIKTRTETYILDKATALDVELKVEVTLSDEDIPRPKSVRLSGNASPYAKMRLTAIIAEDIGIKKEQQIWT